MSITGIIDCHNCYVNLHLRRYWFLLYKKNENLSYSSADHSRQKLLDGNFRWLTIADENYWTVIFVGLGSADGSYYSRFCRPVVDESYYFLAFCLLGKAGRKS
jgi:hypothetical protein